MRWDGEWLFQDAMILRSIAHTAVYVCSDLCSWLSGLSSWYIGYLYFWRKRDTRGIQCSLKLICSSKSARRELREYKACILSVYLVLCSHILLGQEGMSSEPEQSFLLMYICSCMLLLACQTSLGLEFFILNHVTWLCSQAWDSEKQLQCESSYEKAYTKLSSSVYSSIPSYFMCKAIMLPPIVPAKLLTPWR